MARRKTLFLPNNYYHIYNRGAHQHNIFRNDADYKFLLKYVKRETEACAVTVIAYCLMDNHYHFLLRQDGEIEISQFMQAVFNIYTKAFNTKYQLSGTLFEGPFKAIHVDRTEYLLHLCRYIHRNPLEAKMVVRPEQWDYSNYAEFIGKRNGDLVDREFVKINFDTPEAYEDFVTNYVPPKRLKMNYGITCFGIEMFCSQSASPEHECVAPDLMRFYLPVILLINQKKSTRLVRRTPRQP